MHKSAYNVAFRRSRSVFAQALDKPLQLNKGEVMHMIPADTFGLSSTSEAMGAVVMLARARSIGRFVCLGCIPDRVLSWSARPRPVHYTQCSH